MYRDAVCNTVMTRFENYKDTHLIKSAERQKQAQAARKRRRAARCIEMDERESKKAKNGAGSGT